ncbi:MAG: class I SAM-dependent methyltransferase, partial [Eubacterium sp.]|nr:class I SAM-dependent methyltransferase [Eubacterium sp.]
MSSYQTFASVYDLFMDNVPYDDWCELYTDILKEHGIKEGILLDLGCGTGAMTRRFAKKGFDMIGVDASAEMLDMARDAELSRNAELAKDVAPSVDSDASEKQDYMTSQKVFLKKDILYLQQDMRSFELYGTVAAVVSVCDSMNYILEEEDLQQVFKLVNNYLDPGGLFVFDMTTPYQYENVLGENSFCESRDEAAFLWENDYDPESRINEYDLTLFVREDDDRNAVQHENDLLQDGMSEGCHDTEASYRRFVETHYQRAWDPEEVIQLLEESGLEYLGVYGTDEYQPGNLRELQDTDERMYFVARECMK